MLRTTGRIDEGALCAKYGLTPAELAKKLAKMKRSNTKRNSKLSTKEGSSSATSGNSCSSSAASLDGTECAMNFPVITQADLDLLGDNYLEEILGPLGVQMQSKQQQQEQFWGSLPGGSDTALDLSNHMNATSIMDLDDVAVLRELSKELGLDVNSIKTGSARKTLSTHQGDMMRTLNNVPVLNSMQDAPFKPITQMNQGAQVNQNLFANDPMLQGMMPATSREATQQSAVFPFLAPSSSSSSFNRTVESMFGGKNGSSGKPTITTGISGKPVPATKTSQGFVDAISQPHPLPGQKPQLPQEFSASVLAEALQMLQYDRNQVAYQPEERLVRLSAKLFGCSPADLPAQLKSPLMALLNSNGIEGYMRPGCVHLQTNCMLNDESIEALRSGGMRDAVERFLADEAGAAAIDGRTAVFQLGDKLALLNDGKLVHVISTRFAGRLLPAVAALRPVSMTTVPSNKSVNLQVWGFNFDTAKDVVLVRSRGSYLEAEILEIEENGAEEGNGMQCMHISIKGPILPGALQVEVMRGAYCTSSRCVVVASEKELVDELQSLQLTSFSWDHVDLDTLLYEIGSVLEGYDILKRRFRENPVLRMSRSHPSLLSSFSSASEEAALSGLTSGPAPPSRAARRILPFVIERGWAQMSSIALRMSTLDVSGKESMDIMNDHAMKTTGMPILALAVRAQSVEVLRQLKDWAADNGVALRASTPCKRGITSLHLAALLDDGGTMASLLTETCKDALWGWEGFRADDGSTPLGLATQRGTAPDIERVIAKAHFARSMHSNQASPSSSDSDEDRVDRQRSLQHHATKKGFAWKVIQGEAALDGDGGKEAMYTEKLKRGPLTKTSNALSSDWMKEIRMSRMLDFESAELERKYAKWYHAGQVPVDIAFMVILILSQSAWIFRWNMAQDLVLTIVMSILILVNVGYLLFVWRHPSLYVRYREPLCLFSMLIHKVAQMMVTVWPGVGTIYSSTYNPMVALLESSSFSQVLMLSVGVKVRFSYHLPTLLVMLLLSSSMNRSICQSAFPSIPVADCSIGMFAFQAVACFAMPCALVYFLELRSRRLFVQSAVV